MTLEKQFGCNVFFGASQTGDTIFVIRLLLYKIKEFSLEMKILLYQHEEMHIIYI